MARFAIPVLPLGFCGARGGRTLRSVCPQLQSALGTVIETLRQPADLGAISLMLGVEESELALVSVKFLGSILEGAGRRMVKISEAR
jgi:hypothetical protein